MCIRDDVVGRGSSEPSILRVVVKTGIADKLGLRVSSEAVDLGDVYRIARASKAEYLALIPDIGLPIADIILNELGKCIRQADAVIVVAKPKSILRRLWSRMGVLDILKKITGHPRGYLIVFKRQLLLEHSGGFESTDKDVLPHAGKVLSLVYEIPLSDYLLTIYGRLPYPVLLLIREPWRVIKFGFVGLMGAFVNVSVLTIIASILHVTRYNLLSLILPVAAGFEASILFNFTMHELWTFRDIELERTVLKRIERLFKYHLASLASFLIQYIAVAILYGLFGISLPIASFTGIVFGFIVNYIIGRAYTWYGRIEEA